MTAASREYRLEGGPRDGERVTTNGAYALAVPIMQPIEVVPKVVPFNRFRPSFEQVMYYRTGDIYRWEGLVGDAWCDMAVSEQVIVEGGPALRRLIREQMRRTLEEMASPKELGPIVYRVSPDLLRFSYKVRAIVGPRRVELGLRDRESRRSAVGSAVGGAESGGDERIRTAE